MQRELEPQVMDDAAEARTYDAMDHSAPNAAFVDRLIELGAAGYCLDIGTGNGLIPLAFCDRLTEAICVGVDLSQPMLDLAMRRRATSHVANRCTFMQADAKAMRFGDGDFDAVFSNTILHHLPEPKPFLAEAWRVLRPGGVLLIRDLFRPDTDEAVEALVAEHCAGEPDDARQLFRQSLKAALTPDELRALVDELGWSNVQVTVDSDRHVSIQTSAKRP